MRQKLFILLTIILCIGAVYFSDVCAQSAEITPLPGLLDDVKKLADKTNPERLEALKEMLSEKGIPFEVESFSSISRRDSSITEGNNLIVTLGSGNSDIVAGGHYDKVDVGSGVVDNGCAAVILTRVADALKNENLNHRIRIVFFDMEERGLIGSRQFIETHKDDPIVSMINLDVDAYGNTIMMGPVPFTGMNRLYRTAKTVCVENDINFVVFPRYGMSDDRSFQSAGIENISIGIATAQEAHQFWLSLNGEEEFRPQGRAKIMTSMHSENDSMDLVQPEAMTRTYIVVLGTLLKLDKMNR